MIANLLIVEGYPLILGFFTKRNIGCGDIFYLSSTIEFRKVRKKGADIEKSYNSYTCIK
jgi:hypothetical protein